MATTREGAAGRPGRVPADFEPNAWTLRLAERRAQGARILDLTEMNPTRAGLFGLDDRGWQADLGAAVADPRLARYEPDPRGLESARQAVAEYHGGPVPADHVVLTTGTSESYAHLFRSLLEPGESVLIPRPSYPLFEPIAAAEGVNAVTYDLVYDRGAWRLDPRSLRNAIEESGARAIVNVQPNIPTGSALDEASMGLLEAAAEAQGAVLVSDEVFADFPRPGRADRVPSFLGARSVPTFVLGGLSKCCGLPQLKLGWIAACGPERPTCELLERIEWISDLFLSVSTPVQLALPRLLAGRHLFQRRVRERIAQNLERLDALARGLPELLVLPAEAGWTAILLLPPARGGEEWALTLLDRDVAIHPGEFYDLEARSFAEGEPGAGRGDSAVVLSLIVEPATFQEGLATLAESVRSS